MVFIFRDRSEQSPDGQRPFVVFLRVGDDGEIPVERIAVRVGRAGLVFECDGLLHMRDGGTKKEVLADFTVVKRPVFTTNEESGKPRYTVLWPRISIMAGNTFGSALATASRGCGFESGQGGGRGVQPGGELGRRKNARFVRNRIKNGFRVGRIGVVSESKHMAHVMDERADTFPAKDAGSRSRNNFQYVVSHWIPFSWWLATWNGNGRLQADSRWKEALLQTATAGHGYAHSMPAHTRPDDAIGC